ncbi:MAG: hypothetical protein E6J10_11535 [Chloroflexi bacterium]|nr:MAG: hypothetical protein E6J10_11535 [Chloroflexota bacterium]
MQRRPGRDRGSDSIRARRTQPALPGATMPTVSMVAPLQQYPARLYEPQSPAKKRPDYGRRALLQLLSLGALLEVLFLALYPLFAGVTSGNDAAKQALPGLFPWISRLYWTRAVPLLVQLLAQVPGFNLATASGTINFLVLLLALSFILVFIAGRIGSRVGQERLLRPQIRALFCTIMIFTLVFSVTYLFAPGILTLSQDVFLYGLYGRLVTVYHVNPYSVSLGAFPHDLLQQGILQGTQATQATQAVKGTRPPGPVWIDLSIPVVLLARESVANVILGFRLIGLAAHLVNAVLIWVIVGKLKPEARIFATVLYAWNPLVLLLSINEMHLDVVVALFILLAILFFQRNSPILGWVLVLLAVLMNILCLLLLPLFFRLLTKEARILRAGRRVLLWLAVVIVSGAVVVLSYAPYWQGWGIKGLLTSARQAFLQDTAINSLDAALINLPVKLPAALTWLIAPHHWTIFAMVIVGCLLLLGLWLADDVEFVVLFSSWVLLALLVLLPAYWPWSVIVPLALVLCSASRRTILLTQLLTLGAMGSCCFWFWQPAWSSQALVTVGLPLLVWGWVLFFTSTWEMAHAHNPEPPENQPKRRGLSRPAFPSRPSWSGRRR